MENKIFNDSFSSYTEVTKNQITRLAVKEFGGEVGSTMKSFIIGQIVAFLFDKLVAPILKSIWKKGMIAIDIIKTKKAVQKYKDADAKIDRVDSFDQLP
jgi:ribosomal protein L10